jgi:acyl-CoA hydrolase
MSCVAKPDAKSPKESAVEMVQVVLPNDANPLGNILGGRVMHWIDLAGAIVASRHSRRPVVTASMEHLDFHSPIRIGHIVHLRGSLHYVGRTSMEVGVEVYSEDPRTGLRTHTSSAILTYVALDDEGKPHPVPQLLTETEEEKKRFRAAEERRQKRMQKIRKDE